MKNLTFNYGTPIKPISGVFLNANAVAKHINRAEWKRLLLNYQFRIKNSGNLWGHLHL